MSRRLNKVMDIGHLGKVRGIHITPNGTPVANVSITWVRSWKTTDKQKHTETESFQGLALGKLAEIVKDYLEKGSLFFIVGRLQSRIRQDDEDQNQRSCEFVARDLLILNSQHLPHLMDDQEVIYNYRI